MGEKDFSDRLIVGDQSLTYAPVETIRAAREGITDRFARAAVLADLVRLNTLYMIMQAGSGHIGSSFSSTDIITWLWTELATCSVQPMPIPFSSKVTMRRHSTRC
jgi:transketolase